jgi:tRNA dimethylallyltransferase
MGKAMTELTFAAGTKAVLIAGPTASGKSRLAVDLARRHHGTVINADSMQVYRELRVLTARPALAEEGTVPHRLYGHVPAAIRYSVGAWLGDVEAALAEARQAGRLPIVVGGTGLYFRVLTEGLAEIPPVSDDVRREVRALAEGKTSEALHRRLAAIDPQGGCRIRPSDRSRILRALEVFSATGRSLAEWRQQAAAPVLDMSAVARFVLDPDRSLLYGRIDARAEAMIAEGAITEVEAVLALDLPAELPAMKAIGVRQLADHLAGTLPLDAALAGMRTETRRYAKRQLTWFRNQMGDWPRLPA